MSDPNWQGGDYYGGDGPRTGLAVARMIGHITYLCDGIMEDRFGLRELRPFPEPEGPNYVRFDVEEYLDDEGRKLVHRFDANSYVCVSRAIDLHDMGRGRGGLVAAMAQIRARCLLIAIRSDFLFPPEAVRKTVNDLREAGVRAAYWEMDSAYGHDAFLEEQAKLEAPVRAFLDDLALSAQLEHGAASR